MPARGRTPAWLARWWGTRPRLYSRPVWALQRALDVLPWPWGEDALARLFAMVALARPSRRRLALAWARRHPDRAVWPLALGVAAYRGRWVARSALLGLRGPDDLRGRIVLEGETHLAAPGGRILLGFHLGPPNGDLALLVRGHRAAWLGPRRHSPAWSRPAWRALVGAEPAISPDDIHGFWVGHLYRGRALLLDGGSVFIMADSGIGRPLFEISLPGRAMTVRAAWFALHRQTRARVLPVLAHLEGRAHVLRVHPPLPPLRADAPGDVAEWQRILAALVQDHVRRFPEQCPAMAFPPAFPGRGGPPR